MKCSEFETLIDDYIDQRLSPLQQDACRIHCQSCQHCYKKLKSMQDMISCLGTIPSIPMNEEFRKTLQNQFRISNKLIYAWSSVGILAASLLLVISLNFALDDTIHIPLNQSHQVKLLFKSELNLSNVLFSVEVPQHMEISGYNGHQQLQWKGKLKKGKNVLTVPILGKAEKPGYLIMRIQHKGKYKTLKIKLYPNSDWS